MNVIGIYKNHNMMIHMSQSADWTWHILYSVTKHASGKPGYFLRNM